MYKYFFLYFYSFIMKHNWACYLFILSSRTL